MGSRTAAIADVSVAHRIVSPDEEFKQKAKSNLVSELEKD